MTVKRGTAQPQIYKFDIAKRQLTYHAVTTHAGAAPRVTQHTYDTSARRTKTVYPDGNFTEWKYDDRGNVIETAYYAKGATAPSLTSKASYPTCDNTNWRICNKPTSVTDVRGQVTNYIYNATHGGVLTVTAPAVNGVSPQTRYTHTQLSNTGAASNSGVYRLTGISTCQTGASCAGTADEVKTTIGYGYNLLPTTVTQAAGNGSVSATVSRTWDGAGNLLAVDGPLAGTADVTRYRYNAARELIGEIGPDPDGGGPLKHRATRLQVDARGLVTQVEAGTVTSQSDAGLDGMSVLDTVTIGYDAYRRKTREALITGGATQSVVDYSYDGLGRLECTAVRMNPAAFSQAVGACTQSTQGSFGPDRISKLVYNDADEVTQQLVGVGTPLAMAERTITYTPNGQVATLRDAENNATTYEYDGLGRLVKTRFPLPAKGAGASSTTDYEQLTYAANGDLASRRLRDGTIIAYAYDNLGRLTFKNLPGTEPDVTYAYDNLGRMKTVSQPGHTLTHSYDALGRPAHQDDLSGQRALHQLRLPGDRRGDEDPGEWGNLGRGRAGDLRLR